MTKERDIDAVLEAMSKQFMKPVVTGKQDWVELDGTYGTTYIPADVCGKFVATSDDEDKATDEELDFYSECYEGKIESINYVHGYGARLSAPGYMDCTDWTVFPTEDEAKEYLVETYGDDVELDDAEIDEN